MNLPNKLTLLRIILTPIFMVALMVDLPFNYFVAMLIFIVASITDMLDGKIARKRGLVTDFGKFMDPLADKMLTTAAFIGFLAKGIGSGMEWILFIVLFREFMVSSIRLVAASSGGKVIAANIWGKLKTVSQIVAIIFALVIAQIMQIVGWFNIPFNVLSVVGLVAQIAVSVPLWISAILCVTSGVIYLLDNKDFIKQAK
ncbi:MAG: CDP-diacylglycerol--glycerol-3-phosphate 3-phosphatidyltransferase [Ruminococcaceae bacterium]|nr:CDP-diacylglycerol--glycerol-3-phosphate 3-phosphatidyltransferase [Oscillospiraceae bacterium]